MTKNETKKPSYEELEQRANDLADFAIWMTGCGYDFCQHEHFCKQRDKLLKDGGGSDAIEFEVEQDDK